MYDGLKKYCIHRTIVIFNELSLKADVFRKRPFVQKTFSWYCLQKIFTHLQILTFPRLWALRNIFDIWKNKTHNMLLHQLWWLSMGCTTSTFMENLNNDITDDTIIIIMTTKTYLKHHRHVDPKNKPILQHFQNVLKTLQDQDNNTVDSFKYATHKNMHRNQTTQNKYRSTKSWR